MSTMNRLLACLLLLGLVACSSDKNTKPTPNHRPNVQLIAGVADSAATSYRVRFEWRGTDDDGVITRYQYAIDDTSNAAWHDTTATSALRTFRADQVDPGNPDVFTRWHSFYVRAIDDQGAVSRPDSRIFNARNIAPSTRITSPDPGNGTPLHLCRTVNFEWVGEDLDSSRLDHMPRYWEYKAVRIGISLDDDEAVIDSLTDARNLLLEASAPQPEAWIRVATGQRSVAVHGIAPGVNYAFAVRGVDEGGATEPRLIRGQNFVSYVGLSQDQDPFLVVTEPTFGTFRFPKNDDARVSAAAGHPLLFRFAFDCGSCGDRSAEFRYALDLTSPEDSLNTDPNGVGGWTDWAAASPAGVLISFAPEDGEQDHEFWVAARCALDSAQYRVGHIRIHVAVFTFDQFALLVDDARFGRTPSDQETDSYLRGSLLAHASELGTVEDYSLFGTEGNEDRAPMPNDLSIETLSRYQHLFWSENLGQNTQRTGLHGVERLGGALSQYVLAGGRLFIFGGSVAGTLTGAQTGSFVYPKLPPDNPQGEPAIPGFETSSFLWRYLHVRSTIVGVPSTATSEIRAASGLVAARSLDVAYPDLVLDPTKWSKDDLIDCQEDSTECHYRGGLTSWEGILGENGTTQVDFGLDSLYTAETYDHFYSVVDHGPDTLSSPVAGAIIGQRYHSTRADTTNGTAQGRVVWFGFHPWYFDQATVTQAGRAATDWLVNGR